MCQGSVPGEPSSSKGATATTDKPNKRPRKKDPTVIATKEVVGRQVAVWSDDNMEWSKATIAQYNPDTHQHLVRFSNRDSGDVKNEERWINLSTTRFQWLTAPSPTSAPNPTNAGAPKGEDAVGYQVRVFWPGMAKWYQGKIEAYDADTKEHTVKYRDGDIKKYKLRYEAVVYLEKSSTPARRDRPKDPKERKAGKSSISVKKRSRTNNGGAGDSSVDDDVPLHRALKKSKTGRGSGRPSTGATKKKYSKKSIEDSRSRSASSDIYEDEDDDSQDDEDDYSQDDDDDSQDDDRDEENEFSQDNEQPRKKASSSQVHKSKTANNPDAPRVKRKYVKSGKHSRRAIDQSALLLTQPGQQQDPAIPRRRGRPPGSGTGRRGARGRPGRKEPGGTRMMRAEEEIIRSAGATVVGARVAVFWNDEDAFYKGKIIQFDSYHKRHKVVYDDGEEEWVALTREYFRYLTPRAHSAGCHATFRHAMAQLGAAQETGQTIRSGRDALVIQGTATVQGEVAPAPPRDDESSGWEISLRTAGDGRWHKAEVLTYDPQRGHYLLYADGEDEWVKMGEEEVVWHGKLPEGREGLFPGKSPGVEVPAGRGAVGWRVSVFWPGDAAFYPGEITGWDESNGKYEVSYDDGEEGSIKLSEDKIKWTLPPGVAVDHENLERLEVGGGRPRRRVTAAGADSDPDYEFENATGYPSAGRGRPRGGFRGRPGRPSAAAIAAMQQHGWVGMDAYCYGSDALPSPRIHTGGPTPLTNQPPQRAGVAAHAISLQQQQQPHGLPVNEAFTGEPIIHRSITRVASFGCPHSSTEVRLPTPVTVKIYMSGSSSEKKKENTDVNTTKNTDTDGNENEEQEKKDIDTNTHIGASDGDDGCEVPDKNQADNNSDIPTATNNKEPTTAITKQRSLSTAEKLQARIDALDLMARRVGRAHQAIIKGVPTDLPTHVVRPLRLGPPPSVARLVAANFPSVLGPARRTPGSGGGQHRYGRPPGSMTGAHASFHRRRSLDEEDDSDNDDSQDDENEDDDGEDEEDQSFGGGDDEGDEVHGELASSSGSSDDEDSGQNNERSGDEGEEEPVVSPRSPSFPRGGKVKPSAGSGDFGAGLTHTDANGNPEEQGSPKMMTGVGHVNTMPSSPFVPKAVGELTATDSVSNLLDVSIPRNQSAMLLGELPPVSVGALGTEGANRTDDI